MPKDFYQEKIDEIQKLIQAGEFKKAGELVAEELRMPYIPKIYEAKFDFLQKEISLQVIENTPQLKTLPVEDLLQMLASNDKLQSAIALDAVRKHNLWPFKEQLKQIIENWNSERKIEKAFLFEVLCEQKIDIDIFYTDKLVLNPATHISIDKNLKIKEIMQKIADSTLQNPQLQDVALEISDKYFLFKYPHFETDADFVEQIKNISLYMLGDASSLTDLEMQILRDIETV